MLELSFPFTVLYVITLQTADATPDISGCLSFLLLFSPPVIHVPLLHLSCSDTYVKGNSGGVGG